MAKSSSTVGTIEFKGELKEQVQRSALEILRDPPTLKLTQLPEVEMFVTLIRVLAPRTSEAWADVLRLAEQMGFEVTPMHPGVSDPSLKPFYAVAVPDVASGKRFVEAVTNLPAVSAAYLKPYDAPPRPASATNT